MLTVFQYQVYFARLSCVRYPCGNTCGLHLPTTLLYSNKIYINQHLRIECSKIGVFWSNLILAPCLIYWLIWVPTRTGGYVPSTSASDDYLDALKSDSKRRNKTLHAKLSGRPVPPELEEPAPTAPGVADGPYEVRTSYDRNENEYFRCKMVMLVWWICGALYETASSYDYSSKVRLLR